MYHYTYEITYKTGMKYIGVRSSKIKPELDKYMGSSKHTPKKGVKVILNTFTTRKEAVAHEIYLHNYNDVSNNLNYYNKAKQTSIGFDTTGTKHMTSQETKDKISKSHKGKIFSKEHKENISKSRQGLKPSKESIAKMVAKTTGQTRTEEFKKSRTGTKNQAFRPWYYEKNGITCIVNNLTIRDFAIQEKVKEKMVRTRLNKHNKNKPASKGYFKGITFGLLTLLPNGDFVKDK